MQEFPYNYQRNMPHIQREGKPVFITFCTKDRDPLPEQARDIALKSCLHDDGKKYELQCVVIMPDHAHLILTPLEYGPGLPYKIAEIMQPIKSASSHLINKALGRKGQVWLEESFDRTLRSDESLEEKADYIMNNPVRAKLVARWEDYRWLWCRWIHKK